VGRSTLHVDRSSATAHASTAESPESRTIWLIHVVRGLPAGRFQLWCGMSPDLVFTASFRVVCAGVRSGRQPHEGPHRHSIFSGATYTWSDLYVSTYGNDYSLLIATDLLPLLIFTGILWYDLWISMTSTFAVGNRYCFCCECISVCYKSVSIRTMMMKIWQISAIACWIFITSGNKVLKLTLIYRLHEFVWNSSSFWYICLLMDSPWQRR